MNKTLAAQSSPDGSTIDAAVAADIASRRTKGPPTQSRGTERRRTISRTRGTAVTRDLRA